MISQFSAESKYMKMTKVTLKFNLDQKFIDKDWFPPECPMRLYGDNKTAIHIAENDVFHERTKHMRLIVI